MLEFLYYISAGSFSILLLVVGIAYVGSQRRVSIGVWVSVIGICSWTAVVCAAYL